MNRKLVDRLLSTYKSLSRNDKRRLLSVADGMVFLLSIFLAFNIRFRFTGVGLELLLKYWPNILALVVLKLVIFKLLGVYKSILRYTGLEFLAAIAGATALSSGIWLLFSFQLGVWPGSKTALVIDGLLTLILVVAVRLIIRYSITSIHRQRSDGNPLENVLVYGAGIAGAQLVETLGHERGYRVIAFIDDNPELYNQVLRGYRIYSSQEIGALITEEDVTTLILAIPSLSKANRKKLIDDLQDLPINIKTIPTLNEILTNKVSLNTIRQVEVADLLGREEILPEPALLSINITGKSVLVSGAGGSIGSELCRQITKLDPACIVLYELSEFALYSIDMELTKNYPNIPCHAYLGSVTDKAYFSDVLARHQVETIYHAAAYKHVPLVEANPSQGVRNNVFGTLVAEAKVANFVLISTDKAVRPTNVMGASKRCAELSIQALADQPGCPTRFGIVRFGNVLDSSGSVVPLFRQLIANGQPITVTHPEVTRYFMSIPEAVRLVIQAGAMATGGDVFLLEMGEPVRIYDLAEQMIRLSGLVPGKDIKIEISGLRPGEKLYEELLIDGDNICPTRHPKIYSAHEEKFAWTELEPMLQVLFQASQASDTIGIVRQLQKLVTGYAPDPRLLAKLALKTAEIDSSAVALQPSNAI
jgi:FlaA1/EpsC-like NDP-sugar epimerase